MRALILYRSHFGNTRQVAEELARRFEEGGLQGETRDLRLRLPDPAAFDFVLIGAPTRMGRAGWRAMHALRRLRRRRMGSKPLALFDTYGPVSSDPEKQKEDAKWFHPGAAGRLEARARDLGLNVFGRTLRCEVKEYKGPLKEREKEKIAEFARAFLASMK